MQHDGSKNQLRFSEDEWRLLGFEPVDGADERVKPEADAKELWQATSGLLEAEQKRQFAALGMDPADGEIAFGMAQVNIETLIALGNGLMSVAAPDANPDVVALNDLFYGSADQ